MAAGLVWLALSWRRLDKLQMLPLRCWRLDLHEKGHVVPDCSASTNSNSNSGEVKDATAKKSE